MIGRIVGYSMLFCLFLAIGFSAFGYKYVEIGPSFLAFMRAVNNDVQLYKIAIPNIPLIPRYERQGTDGNDILSVLVSLLNGLIYFVNLHIFTINLLSSLVNLIIQVLQTIFAIINRLINFSRNVPEAPLPSVPIV